MRGRDRSTEGCERTEHDELVAWRRGDAAAGSRLLARHAPWLRAYFNRRAPRDAEDLVQDTLLACIEGLGRLRDADALRPYLRGVAWRRLVRTRERAQRLNSDGDLEAVVSAAFDEDRYDRRCRCQTLTACIAGVSDPNRIALQLYYLQGYRSREIAEHLGVPHATVRSRLRRGLVELQRLLPVAACASRPAWGTREDCPAAAYSD